MPVDQGLAPQAGDFGWGAAADVGGPPPWGVGALLLALSDTLSARFGALAVRGELSGFSRAGSGHCYFSLKDIDGAAALLRCAMFRRAASLCDFAPADGHQVEVRGRLAVYEPRGDLQFVVESMRRLGAGTLYEEFLRLRARLEAQGLFDPARKRPLPRHPRALGVVTSLAAAALRDVLTALQRRSPQVRVVVYPCLVQGVDAPLSIVSALALAAQRDEVDAVLLVRGGGSLEDLWAFNDERVVRAVVASRKPVVCGVGHETDVTLSDLAADLRAATPTAAAELAAPSQAELLTRLAQAARLLNAAAQRHLDRQSQRLDLLSRRCGEPMTRVLSQAHRLQGLRQRLDAALRSRERMAAAALPALQARMLRAAHAVLERREARLLALQERLQAAHPQHVLQRGFAWVLGPAGAPVLSAASLSPGDAVEAVFSDGRVAATVSAVRPDAGPA